MANIGWKYFSVRRKIDPRQLVESGKVSDYETFVEHCRSLGVVPVDLDGFMAEFGPALVDSVTRRSRPPSRPAQTAPAPVEKVEAQPVPAPSKGPAPVAKRALPPPMEVGVLEATVWLAGVEDEGDAARGKGRERSSGGSIEGKAGKKKTSSKSSKGS